MTKAELNRAVKKFAKDIEAGKIEPYSEAAKAEFNRLHNADNSFKSFNADSLRILIVINNRYHFVKYSYFGPADY